MSSDEFCLEDDIFNGWGLHTKNVKKFIENIKQDFKDIFAYATPTKATNKCIVQFQAQIDKRAGGKLIWEKKRIKYHLINQKE